ncbi:xanthine dehydrogenase accessory protein XdhC [Cognatishimia sp. WU-CL00825]|uniref:xanthine dehydrogenase accessory protein XdhC n=1 Tax=Cognatishimia sp. WU-CL00825 TaxID=3127658 RepID=UPI00310396C3
MFDLAQLESLLRKHPVIARVATIELRGSGPREVGSHMLVWPGGQAGSIGGGALEYEATRTALNALQQPVPSIHVRPRATISAVTSLHPLGPALGQCCGGAVRLVTEVFTAETVKTLISETQNLGYYLRPVQDINAGSAQATPIAMPEVPLALKRALAQSRAQGSKIKTQYQDGWLLEPMLSPRTDLWIWGAGHVGRALVNTLAPLPDIDLTWIDTDRARFPPDPLPNVTVLPAAEPAQLVAHAPPKASHLMVTFSHALDLELCHQLLRHSFDFAGLIGSQTKWVRFQKRLQILGHSPAQILRITCPIGDPSLGKHPQAIAIGVATKVLQSKQEFTLHKDQTA